MRAKVSWVIIFILLGIVAKTSFADTPLSSLPAYYSLKFESGKFPLTNKWFQLGGMRQTKGRSTMPAYQIQLQASRIMAASA